MVFEGAPLLPLAAIFSPGIDAILIDAMKPHRIRNGLLIAAAVLLAAIGPAQAGERYWRGHHHGHYGHHGHRHSNYGAYAAGAFGTGLVLGMVLSRPWPAPVYVAAPPRARYDCRPTTGTGWAAGRPALFGGTFCYDQYGNGYVVAGSEYLIGYLR